MSAACVFLPVGTVVCLLLISLPCLHADIYRWDTSQVIPGTEGITPGPGVQLDHRELEYAKLGGWNTGDRLDLTGANFEASNLTNARLEYSTLTNANLMGANLANANLGASMLTNANLTGAVVTGTNLGGTTSHGFTAAQLYATQSYQEKNLSGIGLSDNDLTGWDLSGQNLTGVGLQHSRLTGANLADANLTGLCLALYGFTGVNLAGANLTNSQFIDAGLRFADLTGANLTNARFYESSLEFTDMTGANLTRVNFRFSGVAYVNMTGANLTNANLGASGLDYVNLAGANLTNASLGSMLNSVDLTGANLTSGNLGDSTLTRVNLTGSNLKNAYLADVSGLASAKFSPESVYNQWTVFPWDFKPTAADLTMVASPAGDLDADNDLDAGDVDLLASKISGRDIQTWWLPDAAFDLNGDSRVNWDDHRFWVHELKHTWFGDADLNGKFNSADLVLVFQAGKYETQQDAGWAEGDWNGDGVFDSDDFITAFADGGYEQGPRTDVAAVPEPNCLVALALAIPLLTTGLRVRCPRIASPNPSIA